MRPGTSVNQPKHRFSLTALAAVTLMAATTIGLSGCGGSNNPLGTTRDNSTPTTGTPTPTATATPTPVPTATATATPTPTTGTRLGAFFGSTSSTARLTYRDVTTTTTPNPTTGQSTTDTNTITYTTTSGDPFTAGATGQKTQVTLATAQGNVTVTRQEDLEDGKVTGYTYYTLDSNAYTIYGTDALDEQGRTTSRMRYSPAARFSLDLQPGQTVSQSVSVTQTDIDVTDNTSTTTTYNQTFTLNYVGIESVTVPAGTYAKAARVNLTLSFTSPAQNGSPAFSLNGTVTSWYASPVGEVKSLSDIRSTITVGTQNLETRSQSDTQLTAVSGS